MAVQIIFLAMIAVCSAQNVPTATIPAQTIPAGVTGACPSEELLADARQATRDHINSVFTSGLTEEDAASSCSAIHNSSPSGYYWIRPATGPPAVQVYCDFNRQCGCYGPSTWTRVAFVNASDPDYGCPSGWPYYSPGQWTQPNAACGGGWPSGCKSANFSNYGHTYSRVCGRVLGYQWEQTRAFHILVNSSQSIDSAYLDGVSVTHGSVGSRQHIWSFASASTEVNVSRSGCDCSNSDPWPYHTSFVGNDYFCDSGWEGSTHPDSGYADDTLWDGSGCGPDSTCCQFNNPPWFCKTLPQPTTDDLEVRACISSNGADTAITLIELYVQ